MAGMTVKSIAVSFPFLPNYQNGLWTIHWILVLWCSSSRHNLQTDQFKLFKTLLGLPTRHLYICPTYVANPNHSRLLSNKIEGDPKNVFTTSCKSLITVNIMPTCLQSSLIGRAHIKLKIFVTLIWQAPRSQKDAFWPLCQYSPETPSLANKEYVARYIGMEYLVMGSKYQQHIYQILVHFINENVGLSEM